MTLKWKKINRNVFITSFCCDLCVQQSNKKGEVSVRAKTALALGVRGLNIKRFENVFASSRVQNSDRYFNFKPVGWRTSGPRCIFRFSLFADGPQYKVRSPEGSTLSVCGDSEREELSDDDTRSLVTPRDDQSELSFYRRIIEGSTDPTALANRSTKTVRGSAFQDTNTIFCSSKMAKHNTSDDKSKSLGYRPYTIEEYKTLSIPKLDRSLGPDKVEMQAKVGVFRLFPSSTSFDRT